MRTVIHIKTEHEVKENAQKLALELGLNLSDIINASLRNFIRTREIYFSFVPRMSVEFERLLGSINEDIKKKKNLSRPLSSSSEVNDYLDSL